MSKFFKFSMYLIMFVLVWSISLFHIGYYIGDILTHNVVQGIIFLTIVGILLAAFNIAFFKKIIQLITKTKTNENN
jgi:hypothetical protein